jgi:hypothetical protein
VARLQRLDRRCDGQIRLTRAGRADAERQVVRADLLEILSLVRAATADRTALRVHRDLALGRAGGR